MDASTNTKKQPLLTPIMRWFLFAMVLANIGGMMSPMLMPIYLTDLGADLGTVGLIFTVFMIFFRAENFLTFAASWAVFGFGGGMLGPAYQSLITKVIPIKCWGPSLASSTAAWA